MANKFTYAKELKKLKEIVKNIPEDNKKIVEGLIEDASFMAEQLEKLRKYVQENGWSEEYQNGANQRGKKTSVEAEMYVKVQKSYSSVIRQLTEYLPNKTEMNQNKASEEFLKAIGKGKGIELR